MNTVALTKALRFACLPTLSLLILLFFAFFDITKTLEFISSTEPLAVILRIVAFGGEVVLVWIMYSKYLQEEILKGNTTFSGRRSADAYTALASIKRNWKTGDTYHIQDTDDDNAVYVVRKPKSDF